MPKRLSPSQERCLRLSATMRDQQAADHLGISLHTFRSHISEAKRRLGVQDRKAALRALLTSEGGENQRLVETPNVEPEVGPEPTQEPPPTRYRPPPSGPAATNAIIGLFAVGGVVVTCILALIWTMRLWTSGAGS